MLYYAYGLAARVLCLNQGWNPMHRLLQATLSIFHQSIHRYHHPTFLIQLDPLTRGIMLYYALLRPGSTVLWSTSGLV